ncbi:hypothetical protein GGX14DRAFT_391996 [Mycena pura]|uniref:Uncharacterized protein n=1 Tax=Mycena pura TaxID=153505 RepID=A0AAD6YEQ3_9AGAR|nr:hypothetical protein GGX14DRAFT_391996 [Mycena pura]
MATHAQAFHCAHDGSFKALRRPPDSCRVSRARTSPAVRASILKRWAQRALASHVVGLRTLAAQRTVVALGPQGEILNISPCARNARVAFRQCGCRPRLVHFTTDLDNSLEKRFYRHPGVSAQDLVSLPALQTFTACRCSSTIGPRSLGYLLTHLSMPALRRLQLPRTSTPAEGFASSVLLLGEVATRSPLIDIDLTGLAHDSFIHALSNLTRLQRFTAIDLKDLRADTDLPPGTTTARRLLEALRLRDLRLQLCRAFSGSDYLLDFTQRRLDSGGDLGVQGLRRLEIEFKVVVPLVAPEALAPFSVRGLTIETRLFEESDIV